MESIRHWTPTLEALQGKGVRNKAQTNFPLFSLTGPKEKLQEIGPGESFLDPPGHLLNGK